MKKGDFVYIDYIGKVKDTGEIFDLTNADTAKKEGIYNPNVKYRPVPVIVGADFVVKGLDEAIAGMNVGEKKVVEIEPSKAFGERKGELTRLIPMSTFKDQNVDPNPGSYVTINGLNGRVISSGGGRIRVDFNHPLAGKKLEYDIEIKEEIKDAPKKVLAIVNFYSGLDDSNVEVKLDEKDAEVKLKPEIDMPAKLKETIADAITKWVELNKVRFVFEFEKK